MNPTIYSKFGTDKKTEQEGIVLDYGDGMEIRVRRAGGSNIQYEAAITKQLSKYNLQLKHNVMDNAVMKKVLREVYADTVVISWKGFSDAEGNELQFTRENIIKVFTDLPDLFDDVVSNAQKAALFKTDLLNESVGN